ncbi:MAG: hypothetical protein H8D63_00445 [Parcubacteria group bacterium]|nr:hypothetical protein [Parcubacteria group bacterium]
MTPATTSFIPKQSGPEKRKRRTSGLRFLVVIGGIVFIGSLAAAGGVYGYEQFLKNQIEQMRASLEHNQSTLSTKDIGEWKRLDDRIMTLEDILGRHVAFSYFFDILGDATLQNVRFSNFGYEFSEGGAIITLSGESPDYSTVDSQSDIFGRHEVIQDPIFADLSLDDKGNVSFSATFFVDENVISYDAQ